MTTPARPWPRRAGVVGRDLVRTFVVRPVRSNVVRAHGGGLTAWTTIGLGVMTFALVNVGVVAGGRLASGTTADRSGAVLDSSGIGHPLVVPSVFVPLLAVVMVVGTFLALFGAVLARPVTAALAVAFVVATDATPVAEVIDPTSPVTIGPAVALVAALAGVPALRRWRPPLPVLQLLTALAGLLVVVPAFLLLWRAVAQVGGSVGWALAIQSADGITAGLAVLVAPLVFLAGVGTVSFGVTVTEYLRRSVVTLSRGRWWVLLTAFLLLLAWRSAALVEQMVALDAAAWPGFALDLAAALVIVGGAARWWRWAAHGALDPADGAATTTIPLMLGVLGFGLVAAGVAEVAAVLTTVTGSAAPIGWAAAVVRLTGTWVGTTLVPILAGVAALAWAVRRARRTPGAQAGWVGLVGGLVLLRVLWGLLVPPGLAPPGRVSFAHVTTLITVAGALLVVLRRQRPDLRRLASAGAVLALTGLVAQNDFLSDPFAPFLGFTGIGFVLFGVVWGFLTSGGHGKATGLPGLGRTAIMLAYALLSSGLLVWGRVSGSPVIADNIGGTSAAFGRSYLGDALFLAFVVAWLPRHRAAAGRPVPPAAPPAAPPAPGPTADPPTVPIPRP